MNKENEHKKIRGFIYCYDISNKKYVGWTINLRYRHISHLKEKRTNKYFHNSLRKNFQPKCLRIIEAYYDIPKNLQKILNEREIFWIDKLDTYDPEQKKGWNLTQGGQGALGRKQSEKMKEDQSKRMENKKGENHPTFGKTWDCPNKGKGWEEIIGVEKATLLKEAGRKRMENKKGENHPGAKLNEKIVIEIKKLILENKLSSKNIMDTFNLTKNMFYKIKHNRCWKYL